ncbi:hypothetical protein C2S52_000379 [Perilla frutescens var. hirtella]|uniref:Uncharacterized protein n=1 Tax=Perilla frutescens var. hirtella TaxID=608512 RepID=A0AAD4JGS7_PERFH|nr:hypothetical protein C2S52_000379 [Perilla frutescens var. hirtella]KAH6832863.1 hypothetical protein C2S53_014374 [Perilla frutescens var. hirtella]
MILHQLGRFLQAQINQSWALQLGQDVDFILKFIWVVENRHSLSSSRGLIDGDEAASAKNAFVNESMAAPAQQLRLREVAWGQFEIFIVEFLDFDGFFVKGEILLFVYFLVVLIDD